MSLRVDFIGDRTSWYMRNASPRRLHGPVRDSTNYIWDGCARAMHHRKFPSSLLRITRSKEISLERDLLSSFRRRRILDVATESCHPLCPGQFVLYLILPSHVIRVFSLRDLRKMLAIRIMESIFKTKFENSHSHRMLNTFSRRFGKA